MSSHNDLAWCTLAKDMRVSNPKFKSIR